MKKYQRLLLTAVCMVFISSSVPLFPDDALRTAKTVDRISNIMGRAAVDTTIEGVRIRCWVISQHHHGALMEKRSDRILMGMDADPTDTVTVKDPTMVHVEMGKETTALMTAGTHHVLLNVTDSVSGNEIVNTSAKLLMVTPSGKESSVSLKQMMNNFGMGITMTEKGWHHLTLDVNANGFSRIEHFNYRIK
jgi:hypothetical protein